MIALPPPPDAANPHLAAALAVAAASVPPAQVDQVWVFPPHTHGAKETGLAVLAAYAADADDPRRTLFTVRYEAETVAGRPRRTDEVLEEGTVPCDRLDRLIEGIVRRLGGGMETPEVRELAGDADAWSALLGELGAGG